MDAADTRTPAEVDRDEAINATIEGLLDRLIADYAGEADMTARDRTLSALATLIGRASGLTGGRLLALVGDDEAVDCAIEIARMAAEDAGDTLRTLSPHHKAAGLFACATAMCRAASEEPSS